MLLSRKKLNLNFKSLSRQHLPKIGLKNNKHETFLAQINNFEHIAKAQTVKHADEQQ